MSTIPATTAAPSKYHRRQVRLEARNADGSLYNYSVTEHMLVKGYLLNQPGVTVVAVVEDVEITASERVLVDSGVPERHWDLIRADARRMGNMARDAGRPSDAMRSSVRAFKAGHLTAESFAAAAPSGHYPDDRA